MVFTSLPGHKIHKQKIFKEISPRISTSNSHIDMCVYSYIYIGFCVETLAFGTFCVQRIHIGIWDPTLYNANFYGGLSLCLFQNAGPSPFAFVLTPILPWARKHAEQAPKSETEDVSQSALQEGLYEIGLSPPLESAPSHGFANEPSFRQHAKCSATVSLLAALLNF